MTYTGQILALDLARVTGFAFGRPTDRVPVTGSIAFAKEGASTAAVFAACRRWLNQFLDEHPTVQWIVFEAPLAASFKRGKTNKATIRMLNGIVAVVEELLYSRGGYNVREAEVRDVRIYFIGSNPRREQAKRLTKLACRARGWDVVDDNAADAAAIWDYQSSLIKRG